MIDSVKHKTYLLAVSKLKFFKLLKQWFVVVIGYLEDA